MKKRGRGDTLLSKLDMDILKSLLEKDFCITELINIQKKELNL